MTRKPFRKTTLCITCCFVISLLAPIPGSAKNKNARAFVPPSTKPVENKFALDEAVAVEHRAGELPGNAAGKFADAAQQSMEVDLRIAKAQNLLAKGTELLNTGETTAARVEFDKAIQALATSPANLPGRDRLERAYHKAVEEVFRLEVDAAQSGANQEPVFDRSPIDDIANMTFPIEPSLKGKVKEQLEGVVSQLPLEMADPVLSYINFFTSTRGRMVFETGLRRSGRYAPMIRRILDEEGLPQELIFLAQAESAFLPRAVSVKSATGMWQFMLWRGREYQLNQTSYTDDRLDPEKATRAAARHLRDLYAQFGDWYLAIAAYNCGPLNVERAIQRTGYADFWELYKRNVLPRETANYLPIILAMTIMAKNPAAYGLENLKLDPAMEYDTLKVTANTHLALVADLSGVSLQEVRELNPGVLKLIAPADYEIRVPKGSGRTVLAALESVPSERRACWRVHRVGSNETVASLAKQYRVPEKSIADANGAAAFEPQAGDFVIIPVAYPGPVEVRPAARTYAAKGSTRTTTTRAASTTVRKPATSTQARKPVVASKSGNTHTATAARRTAAPVRRTAPQASSSKPQAKPAHRAGTAASGPAGTAIAANNIKSPVLAR